MSGASDALLTSRYGRAISTPLLVPTAAAALLVAAAGASKIHDPAGLQGALTALRGEPVGPRIVRGIGVAEVAVGVAALTVDHRAAPLLLGLLYVGFAAFVVLALRRRTPLRSCGCLGSEDVPPTPLHAVVNVVLASSAVATLVMGDPPLLDGLDGEPLAGASVVALAVVTAYLLRALLTDFVLALRAPLAPSSLAAR